MYNYESIYDVTKRDFEILEIFWTEKRCLIASDIPLINPELSSNTVIAALRKLLARNLVAIDKIVYSGTVLTRSYKPTYTQLEFEVNKLIDYFTKNPNPSITLSHFICVVLDDLEDVSALKEMDELKQIISNYKKLLLTKSTK